MKAGEPHDVTCVSQGARPPAVLDWRVPQNVAVILRSQSNAVQGDSYVSRRIATITPSTNDQGKSLRCVVSHPKLQNTHQRSVNLNVQG